MRLLYAAFLFAISASPALAQRAPVIVIPGRPGIPVMMNGVDISYSVVEGDFGLVRPIGMVPTVVYRPVVVPLPVQRTQTGPGSYFPATGEKPGYGRLETVPPPGHPLPKPAESYRKSWSSESDPTPPTSYPPMIVAPEPREMRRDNRDGRQDTDGESGDRDEMNAKPGRDGAPDGPGGDRR
jgi:hypothetical protein